MSYQVTKGMLGKATNLSHKGFLQKRIKHPPNASILNTTKDARQFLWSMWIDQVLNNPTLHSGGADQGCSSFATAANLRQVVARLAGYMLGADHSNRMQHL